MKKLLLSLSSIVYCSLIIAPTGLAQTSRTWDGSSGTDWNTAANWTPSGVPATIDHVTIPNTTNKPVLDGNVTIANFSITGGELDLDGDTLTVNGTLSMTGGVVKDGLVKKTSTSTITITGVTVECELDISGNTIGINTSRFKEPVRVTKTGGSGSSFNGNVWEADTWMTNTATGFGSSINLAFTASDTFYTHLTLNNSGSGILLGNQTSNHAVVLAGSGTQSLSVNSSVILIRRLTVNKPSGSAYLSGDLIISHFLNLTKGIVRCESGAQVTVNSGATVSGTSNLSYIEGPVLKKGNQAFTFPVGRNGAYRPISITAPTTSTHSFKAEYFESNSDPVHSHSSKDGSLDHLSENEYWTLTRVVGTSTPKVTLSWDTLTSCTMSTPLSSIHVAGWNGSQWNDLGNGATTGNIHKGTIQTTAAVTSFNAFILEHDSGMGCRDFGLSWAPTTLVIDSTANFFLTSSNLPYHHTLSLKVEGAGPGQYTTWDGFDHTDTLVTMVHMSGATGTLDAPSWRGLPNGMTAQKKRAVFPPSPFLY